MLQPGPVARPLLLAVGVALVCAGSAHATAVVAVGDFGVGGDTERAIGSSMRTFASNHPLDGFLTLGDNDYTESPTAFRRNWHAAFAWVRSRNIRISGALGNHDVRVNGGGYEFKTLNMPRAHYKRRIGNIAFFILNSSRSIAAQSDWLRSKLARSTARWKVAVFHHPAWTCGSYRSTPAVVDNWVPLFERYGVDLVLSGHDHNYQRFAPRNGVRYIVHGGGGAHTYSIERCPSGYPKRRFARAVHGFLYLYSTGSVLRVSSITRRGRHVIDRVTIR
jgi:Calcineurin-like phosphoesterase